MPEAIAAYDTVIVVDWSAAAKARQPSPDSIWIGTTSRDGTKAQHFPTRPLAERWLKQRIGQAQDRQQGLLIGFDFAFGLPSGGARSITGTADVRAVWAWLADRIEDRENGENNRFDVAAEANRRLGGRAFWGAERDSDLTLKRQDGVLEALGLTANREVEGKGRATGAKSVWQLTGAGAVGSQSLVGLPMIHRLSQSPSVTVWPFETPGRIALAEVYPSLLKAQVDEEVKQGWMRDAAQVRLLSLALWQLGQRGQLWKLLALPQHPAASEEGWILGVDHRDLLKAALR